MLILGIETSTAVSSVALWSREGPVAGALLGHGRHHVEFLVPAIERMCADAGSSMDRVTGVAVGLGPGLFTSMRVGIATAKTIAQALTVPVVGISSLDLIAFGVRFSPKLICACTDAHRGEVFAAFYRKVPGGVERVSDYGAWTPDALAAEVVARDEETLFAGNGAMTYMDVLGRLDKAEVARGGTQYPRADALCELAIPRLEREEFEPVFSLEPLYIRKSDAEIKWEERGVTIERPNRVKIPKKATR